MSEIRSKNDATGVLIVAPLRYLASIPFMMGALNYLSDHGCTVYLVVPADLDPPLKIDTSKVFLSKIPSANNHLFKKLLSVFRYVQITRKLVRKHNIYVVAGLSQLGIILGAMAVKGTNAKLIYLNDELWFNDYESRLSYYFLKRLERISNKKASLTVTQDRIRGRLLSLINSIDRRRIRFLPNSRSGLGRVHRTYLLHDIIRCTHDTKIILWNGAASEGDGALEIAQKAIEWPDKYLFVFHFRSNFLSPYKRKLIEMHGVGRNYHISGDFDYDELENVFGSAHIGIAYYPDRGINARYIASSSGKLNSFLKVGVPCVVSRLPGLRWVERTGAGVLIDSPTGITEAIQKIDADYERFCDAASKVFDDCLQFDAPFEKIVSEMKAESTLKIW